VRQALAAHPPSFTMTRANQRLTIPTLCVVTLLLAAPARAYTTPWMHLEDTEFDKGWGLLSPANLAEPDAWESHSALTGGWGGRREFLHRDGIDFAGLYMMESAGNPLGGDLHKLRYTYDLGLGVYLDLDKLLGLKGTYFLASAPDRAGNDLPPIFRTSSKCSRNMVTRRFGWTILLSSSSCWTASWTS
jgi:carbohydrate-selective porin OprB